MLDKIPFDAGFILFNRLDLNSVSRVQKNEGELFYSNKIFLVIIVMVTLLACSQTSKGFANLLATTSSEQLHTLIDSDWQRYLKTNPAMASYLGDKHVVLVQ
jgi:hypothetical protein